MKREKSKMLNNNRFSNPIIKDEIEILYDTKEKLIFRTSLESGGGQAKLHYHTKITEKFRGIEGELTVIINGEKKILKPNRETIIKPYDTHQFLNVSSRKVVFEVEITPGHNISKGLQIFYGLAKDGKVFKNGLPKNIFHTAIGLKMLDAYITNVPVLFQKFGVSLLAKIAGVIGLERKIILKYCD